MLATTSITEAAIACSQRALKLFYKGLWGVLSKISHQGLRDAQPSSGSGVEA